MGATFPEEELWSAWERVQENNGCAGTDGVSIHNFAHRTHAEIAKLRQRIDDGTYRAFPLLKIVVEKKPNSPKLRTLLVPTVRDRILQTAVARRLSRSFEEEFLECSYGYRPGRSVDRAIARIRKCRDLGYRFVVDADVEKYFDNVDIELLLHRLALREIHPVEMALLRQWIRGCLWDGSRILPIRRGIPQGSPVSPVLANFFLEDFDRELEKSGKKLVRYADDFVILSQTAEGAQEAMEQTAHLLEEVHLRLNTDKTRITDFEHGFHFLGVLFLEKDIWIPWKNDRPRGRILYMAPPLPAAMRERFRYAPPKGQMEAALEKAAATRAPERAPARKEPAMAYLYLTEQGAMLRKAGDRFLVEKDDEVILDLPYHKLDNVALFGNIQVTTQALGELMEKGVNLSLFSRQGAYRGSITPPRSKNVEPRVKQFERYKDGAAALGVARALIRAKLENGMAVVDRYREKAGAPGDEWVARRKEMDEAAALADSAADLAQLMGAEGAGAKAYFACAMAFNKSALEWAGRRKHPAPDPLNALLSFTYVLLMQEIEALLDGMGLDPYLGFLHQVDYGRPSLALDLLEAFRHPVADRLVLATVNQGIIDGADFQQQGPGMYLAAKPLKRYLGEYERWMSAKDAAGQTYRGRVRGDVEGMVASLRSGGAFEPFRWRQEEKCNTSSVTM